MTLVTVRPTALIDLVSPLVPKYNLDANIATGAAEVTSLLNQYREDDGFVGTLTATLRVPRSVTRHQVVGRYKHFAIERVLAAYKDLSGVTVSVATAHGKTTFTAVYSAPVTTVAPRTFAHDWAPIYSAA